MRQFTLIEEDPADEDIPAGLEMFRVAEDDPGDGGDGLRQESMPIRQEFTSERAMRAEIAGERRVRMGWVDCSTLWSTEDGH